MRPSVFILFPLAALGSCSEATKAPEVAPWTTGTTYRTRDLTPADGPKARGLIDVRGLIHAHSAYSHDACDDEPIKNGVRDQMCLDDFRAAICAAQHDFVMLTDHQTFFADIEFEEAVLHRSDLGDALLERGGLVVGSQMKCPDGSAALILPGFESGTMSVGLEQHVGDDPEARRALYSDTSTRSLQRIRDEGGAVILLQHTEDWTVEQLSAMPIDGFEMFNLHANTLVGAGSVLEIIFHALEEPEKLPSSDLIELPIWSEDPRYLQRWGSVLARGHKRVTTIGTDCHQNAFPAVLPDGERGDSYRRMMVWMSNHLLIRPNADGTWDDQALKSALKEGRLYGAFEVVGYPVGFDYHAVVSGVSSEMGSEVQLSDAPELVVKQPSVHALDPGRTPPIITTRVLRAVDGGFEEVASGAEDLVYAPTQPGAYRAEVRIEPRHLYPDMGTHYRPQIIGKSFVWVYANPIYVR